MAALLQQIPIGIVAKEITAIASEDLDRLPAG
jgi:hypothetical protein